MASDVSALLEHTNKVIFVENGEVVTLVQDRITITDLAGKVITRTPTLINGMWLRLKRVAILTTRQKIFEQPGILTAILKSAFTRARSGSMSLKLRRRCSRRSKRSSSLPAVRPIMRAWSANTSSKSLPISLFGWIHLLSFVHAIPKVGPDTLVIAVSQSGETADTLAGLREAKAKKAHTMTICNVLGSTLSREAKGVIFTHAGPEIAVASTKAYTAQMAIFYLFGLYLGSIFKTLKPAKKEYSS